MHVPVETVVTTRRHDRFRALPETEGRVLLLIDAFSGASGRPRLLDGRVKLAKLDFLVRYPKYLARVLRFRNVALGVVESVAQENNPIQERMIRYRYGPWDPSYYAVLGSLIGRGLVVAVPAPKGIGYRTTDLGHSVAASLAEEDVWADVSSRTRIVKRHLDYSGSSLMNWLYEAIPEMANADWHEELD
jgi:hypothetical protein